MIPSIKRTNWVIRSKQRTEATTEAGPMRRVLGGQNKMSNEENEEKGKLMQDRFI